MRKRKWICYILISVTLLCSCGKEPIASNKAITYAKKAIEIGEDYLSGELPAADARSQLDDIEDEMSYAKDYEAGEYLSDDTESADHYLGRGISVVNLYIGIDSTSKNAESYDKLKEYVDQLKEMLDYYD